LVDEQDVTAALHDLEGVGQVRRARNAGQVASRLRVVLRPAGTQLLALRERFGLVRDLAVVRTHVALTGRDRADRTELPRFGNRLGRVGLEVPVRGADGLPDAVQVRLAADTGGLRSVVLRETQAGQCGEGRAHGDC